MGRDIGTRFIKTCIVENDRIIGYSIDEANREFNETLEASFLSALKMAGIKKRKIKKTITTGYGRMMFENDANTISEGICLAKAAFHLDKDIKTIIDTGSLFIHIATINEKGKLDDHCENEKCAAGSGKFLEMIAEAINVPIDSISAAALTSSAPYTLSNTCSVFAESEVISQINAGADSSDIIAGVIHSIASKISTLLSRVAADDQIAVVGGVAKIEAFCTILAKELKRTISPLPIDCQIATAYGAALLAQDKPPRKFFGLFNG